MIFTGNLSAGILLWGGDPIMERHFFISRRADLSWGRHFNVPPSAESIAIVATHQSVRLRCFTERSTPVMLTWDTDSLGKLAAAHVVHS